MNVQPLVHSRAHRILKRMSSYRTIKEQNGTVPLVMRALTFHQGEKVLGIYKNKADECDETLVITTCGIYLLQNNTSQYIRYDEIAHIEAPSKEQKHELDGLVAHLTCGEVMKIPIRGGKGRFRDAWPFLQFLTRVMSDLQKTAKQPIHDLKIDRALTGYGSDEAPITHSRL